MDNNTVLISVIGTCVTAIGILAYVIRSFLADRKPTNGNGNGNGKGKQLDDIEGRLTEAVSGFRESHIEEKMILKTIGDDLKELKTMVGVCADILKKI